MAGIAGIAARSKTDQVKRMLERISYRGDSGTKIIESGGSTLGAVWLEAEAEPTPRVLQERAVWDGGRPPLPKHTALKQERSPFALTAATSDGMLLARDALGACPLYYGRTVEGNMCFASEVKALLEVAEDIHEFPPGASYDSQAGFQTFFELEQEPDLGQAPEEIAAQLRHKLEKAVSRQTGTGELGCWLSGHPASNSLAALARPNVEELHTFAVGTPGTPDLDYAQRAASLLQTEHHEITITLDEVLAPLPAVIWYLESFDVTQVRSSVTRFLAAKRAADYVDIMLFDEGAEELFGSSATLGELPPDRSSEQIVESAQGLHNSALQRVDRCTIPHGLVGCAPFLDLDLFEFSLSIPPELRARQGGETADAWILRQALACLLPEELLRSTDTDMWCGAGVGFLLALSAEDQITDQEFYRERVLPNGWKLHDKEELMYYRIFRERFGELDDLSWMRRTEEANSTT